MKEEAEAYPEETRPRLISIKKAALETLIEEFDDNTETVASHYPGWEKEDLEALKALL